MKLKKFRFFFCMFLFAFCVSIINCSKVSAAEISPTDIDDGIQNWQEKRNYSAILQKVNDDYYLGYTFGFFNRLNQITNANVKAPNVFFYHKGNYVNAYYSKNTGNSSTSLGYGISTSPSSNPQSTVMPPSMTGGPGARKYFEGTDSSGNTAIKIMLFSNDGKLEYETEIHPSGIGILQITQYIKNISDDTLNYGIIYGADTELDGNDDVPVKSLGNNRGLYIENDQYKLNTYIDGYDGPKDYSAKKYIGLSTNGWLTAFDPSNYLTGKGQKSDSDYAGRVLLSGSDVDTAYSLLWPYQTGVKPGQTNKFSFEQGMQASSYVSPKVTVNYKNNTTEDTVNRVRDKLSFHMTVSNTGLRSNWVSLNFKSFLGSDLDLDLSSLKIVNSDGTINNDSQIVLDSVNGTLTAKLSKDLKDNQEYTITFDATIKNSAAGKDLVNNVEVTGIDYNSPGKPIISAKDSVKIPVQKRLVFTFTNQVRNASSTLPGGSFSNTTTAQVGDVIDYKLIYGVGLLGLAFPGGTLRGGLPTGLDLNGPVKLTYSTGVTKTYNSLSAMPIDYMLPGSNVIIEFKAIANGNSSNADDEQLSYTPKIDAPLLGILPIGGITANTSTVNIQKQASLDYVPDNIDFGIVTPWGNLNKRKNVSTSRNGSSENTFAIKNYRTGNDIQVSYDNDGDNAMKNGNNKLEAADDGILLYLNQQQIDGTKELVPITTSGTSLSKKSLNGSNIDLTEYVGKNQFELRAKNKNLKVGTYSGKITWNLVDSLSNN